MKGRAAELRADLKRLRRDTESGRSEAIAGFAAGDRQFERATTGDRWLPPKRLAIRVLCVASPLASRRARRMMAESHAVLERGKE